MNANENGSPRPNGVDEPLSFAQCLLQVPVQSSQARRFPLVKRNSNPVNGHGSIEQSREPRFLDVLLTPARLHLDTFLTSASVAGSTEGPQFGVLGEFRVNVRELDIVEIW